MNSKDIYHLTTKPEHSPYYKKFLATPQASRLSQAALETLAIIAYEQPITRIEIEEIRGVKSDRPVQTLLARALIEEVGRKDTVGRPISARAKRVRSEEHTSELQSRGHLVCRLLREKKNK